MILNSNPIPLTGHLSHQGLHRAAKVIVVIVVIVVVVVGCIDLNH